MSGFRVQHDTMRDGVFVIQTPPALGQPYMCPRCAKVNPRAALHTWKTHHIEVDSEGYAFVSQGVLDILKRNQMGGFTLINEVAKPPDQGVGEVLTQDGHPLPERFAGAVLLEGRTHG